MKKGENKITFYNVLFPIWFLILFPITWVVILPANFIIDSLVVLISMKVLKVSGIGSAYKKIILRVWMIGFASDFVGAGILFLGSEYIPAWREYLYSISWNPFDNWYAVLYVAFATISSGVVIYLLNYKLAFNRSELIQKHKRTLALALAVFTAPYIFLYPSALINGSSWDQLHFMTNHIVKTDEFRLEVTDNTNTDGKTYIMYRYEGEMKDAVNQAKKITGNNTIKFEPDCTLNFYNRDYTDKREISVQLKSKEGYFKYKGDIYLMDQEKIKQFRSALNDARQIQGKLKFTISPDPASLIDAADLKGQRDKDGRNFSDYPIFEDSKYEYYGMDKILYDSAVVIRFDGREEMDIYSALETGLVTPRELMDHGVRLTEKSRE